MADVIADPELDPAATYAVDPARARALTARVVASGDEPDMRTTTPLTGAPLATLPVSSARDVVKAVALARAAQGSWVATSLRERAEILLRLHDLVLDHQPELLDLVQLESGKARGHAFEEVADCAIVARHYARRGPAMLADTRHPGAFPLLSQAVEHRRPKGVVGIVSPWNYPLSLAVSDAIPALLAGNAVVLRPDPQGSLTALAAVELFAQAGLPDGVLQVVLGPGDPTGQAVVDHTDYVSFTGSTATGRRVAEAPGDAWWGCRWSWAARTPCTSPPTRTCAGPSTGPCGPASARPGSCASAPNGSSSTPTSTTSSCPASWSGSPRCGSRRACTGAPTWAAW